MTYYTSYSPLGSGSAALYPAREPKQAGGEAGVRGGGSPAATAATHGLFPPHAHDGGPSQVLLSSAACSLRSGCS